MILNVNGAKAKKMEFDDLKEGDVFREGSIIWLENNYYLYLGRECKGSADIHYIVVNLKHNTLMFIERDAAKEWEIYPCQAKIVIEDGGMK